MLTSQTREATNADSAILGALSALLNTLLDIGEFALLVRNLNGANHLAPISSEYSFFMLRSFPELTCVILEPMVSVKRGLKRDWKRRNRNLQMT